MKNALGDLLSQRVLNFLQRFCSEKPRALRIQALHSLTEPPVPPKAGALKGNLHRPFNPMEVSGRCLFLREHILAHAAQGAHPILRKLVKGSTRIDSIVRIAYRGIINIAAYIAYILIHNSNTPYCGLISLI